MPDLTPGQPLVSDDTLKTSTESAGLPEANKNPESAPKSKIEPSVEANETKSSEPIQSAISDTTKETKKESEPNSSPIENQYIHFRYSQNNPDDKGILANIRQKTQVPEIDSLFNLTIPGSDSEVVGVNLDIPDLVESSDEAAEETMKLTSHKGVKTPEGPEVDFDHYHADGGEDDAARIKEGNILARRNAAWFARQKTKAELTADGSGDLLTIGDFNESIVVWSKGEGKLIWNEKFFQAIERAFPNGIYGISIPNEVIMRRRGDLLGSSFMSNQTLKTEIVYCAKTIIVHTRADKAGNAINHVNIRDLLQRDPAEVLKIQDFKQTITLKDHVPAHYYLYGMVVTAWANMSTQGNKAFNNPKIKLKDKFLTTEGAILGQAVTLNQITLTELGGILSKNLAINFKFEPGKFVDDKFSRVFNKAVDNMKTAKQEPELRASLKTAIIEWFSTKSYADFIDGVKEPIGIEYDPNDIGSWQKKINHKTVDKLVIDIVKGKKNYFDEFVKIFKLEPYGGYTFENIKEDLDNSKVDKYQAKSTVQNVIDAITGKIKSIVLGGDSQETSKVRAVYHFETESSVLPKVQCFTLEESDFITDFTGNARSWANLINTLVENNPKVNDYFIRYNKELYYVNTYNNGKVSHISQDKCDAELYKEFMNDFDNAAKKSNSFFLSYKDHNKILDEFFKVKIALKGSKDERYHNNIEQEFGITQAFNKIAVAAKKLATFGLYATGAMLGKKLASEAAVNEKLKEPASLSMNTSSSAITV